MRDDECRVHTIQFQQVSAFFGIIQARGGQLICLGGHLEKTGFSGGPYLLIRS